MSYSALSLKIESGSKPKISIKNPLSGQTLKTLKTNNQRLQLDYLAVVGYLKSLGFIYVEEIDAYARKNQVR